MRALSFLAPKGLRQKRISQEQFAKPGKLTAISCFLLGSECAPHGGVGLGLERLKPPIPLFKRRLRASFFMRFIASS